VKYRVDRAFAWGTFAIAPAGSGQPAKVVDAADLKDADGQPLPGDVIQLQVRRKVLVPLDADTPREAAKAAGKAHPKE